MLRILDFVRDTSGSVHIEYSVIALLISVGIIGAATSIGVKSGASFNTVSSTLS